MKGHDIRDFVPHLMRFTKGIDNTQCFIKDHDWEKTNTKAFVGFLGEFAIHKCRRCGKEGFIVEGLFYEAKE